VFDYYFDFFYSKCAWYYYNLKQVNKEALWSHLRLSEGFSYASFLPTKYEEVSLLF